jgi:hypothetical protein
MKQKTQDYIKAWGVKDVPVAQLLTGKFAIGAYPAFALLAWTKARPNNWPLVAIHLKLLEEDLTRTIGTLALAMPFTPKTERHVCCFLEDLGWDGRAWPVKDHGWPEDTEEGNSLLDILRAIKLGATLTFPPQEQGTPVLTVPVLSRTKVYSLAPFDDEPPVPRHLEALRQFAAEPKPFVSDWNPK